MIQYKGYFILGGAVKIPPNSPAWWRSQGSVFTNTPEGAVLIKQLEGVIFESKQAAEAHGLELCKKWIDENPNTIQKV
jgi:hypothetical protein